MPELHFTQNLRRHTPCPSYSVEAPTVAHLLARNIEDYPGVRTCILDAQGALLAFGSTTSNLWVSENRGKSWSHISATLPPVYYVRFSYQ